MSFANVQELWAAINLKLLKSAPYAPSEGNAGFCYTILKEVSRSFAGVILELPKELKDSVRAHSKIFCKSYLFFFSCIINTKICLFYLVLRALDSVEDYPNYPKDVKVPLLRNFWTKLEDRNFCVKGCGTKPAEVELLEHYYRVVDVYMTLEPKFVKHKINFFFYHTNFFVKQPQPIGIVKSLLIYARAWVTAWRISLTQNVLTPLTTTTCTAITLQVSLVTV